MVCVFVFLFLLITFGFSAFEKIFSFGNSVSYYKTYFSTTFLERFISFLLRFIIFVEIVISIFLSIGLYEIFSENHIFFGKIALYLSCILLLIFLVGQRIVKDYEGARGIAIYFIICLFGLFLCS